METQLREVISDELRRRHGYGLMTSKIKPVHIANALLREEHQTVGKMADLKDLMRATANGETAEDRLDAVGRMLERNRERWGRLGEDLDLRRSLLVTRVLPLLRTILGTDGAAFGSSPEFSSFSSPTALTVTRDASDEQAGAFVHRLWSGPTRLRLLDILRDRTAPPQDFSRVDDLTAVLIPLTDGTNPARREERPEIQSNPLSEVEECLRAAARDLASYEDKVLANPMATLQRIVLLASISLFFHAATRAHECTGLPRRVLLLDASNSRTSVVADVSEASVTALFNDAREHMAHTLADLLTRPGSPEDSPREWVSDPEGAVAEMFRLRLKGPIEPNLNKVVDALDEIGEGDGDVRADFPRRLVAILESGGGRSLDAFLRLLGIRAGLLYPQQKNPQKRLIPMDRTLEVLVAATFDLSGRPLEYRDFLDELYRRWHIVVGGRLEDGQILADAGTPVSSTDLTENSERFLTRLQGLGLARKMADSVAVVGLMETNDVR
jgi:hypothetical protein